MTRAEKKVELAKQKVQLAKDRIAIVMKNKELADTLVEFKAQKLNKVQKALKKAKKVAKETASKKEIAKAKLDFARKVHNEIQ